LAQKQGLVPALYRCLQFHADIPQPVRDRLSLLYRVNAARNQYLLDTLGEILAVFASGDLPAIPYKGPILAATIYNGIERRACGDLDLLVHRGDVLRARDLLLAHNFKPVHHFRDQKEEVQRLQNDCEYNLERTCDGVNVELHWAFRPKFFPFPLDMEGLWSKAKTINVGGIDTLTLAPDDLLLVLCVHGAKHCWERLGWICDIAALLRANPELDGYALSARAKELRCERVLWLGLTLAQDLLGVTAPDPFRAKPPSEVDALVTWVRQSLLAEPGQLLNQRKKHSRALFHLMIRDRLQDRLPLARHWAGILFQNTKEAWGA
jgi:hypothetical protein